jgi:hypothetical protein
MYGAIIDHNNWSLGVRLCMLHAKLLHQLIPTLLMGEVVGSLYGFQWSIMCFVLRICEIQSLQEVSHIQMKENM